MKEGVIRLDMDIKVIEQMIEQALKELKNEQPKAFAPAPVEHYTGRILPIWCNWSHYTNDESDGNNYQQLHLNDCRRQYRCIQSSSKSEKSVSDAGKNVE